MISLPIVVQKMLDFECIMITIRIKFDILCMYQCMPVRGYLIDLIKVCG